MYCQEREPEHVIKTTYIEELRTEKYALKNIEFTMWPKVSIYPAGLCYTISKKVSGQAT